MFHARIIACAMRENLMRHASSSQGGVVDRNVSDISQSNLEGQASRRTPAAVTTTRLQLALKMIPWMEW